MAKILDLADYKKTISGQMYTERLEKMDLFSIVQETIDLGRLLKGKGLNLSKEEKLRAKVLFQHIKTREDRGPTIDQVLDDLIKMYKLV